MKKKPMMYGMTGAQLRKEKRFFNRQKDWAVQQAYYCGQDAAYKRHVNNPYPLGRRHDEFERGLAMEDCLGNHHGSNV